MHNLWRKTMKRLAITVLGLAMLGAAAFAEEHASGDADAGKTVFNKCKTCHSVVDDEGEVIVRGGQGDQTAAVQVA